MTSVSNFEKIKTQNIILNNSYQEQSSSKYIEKPNGISFKSVLETTLHNLDKNWLKAERHSISVIKSVPENYKPMLQAQILISNLGLQVELVTKVADGVQSTIKKLQQQNS